MEFIKFEVSKNPKAKYDALVLNKKTNKIKRVSFGARAYQHYQDKTGVGAFSHLNHNDEKRRKLYRARHGANGYQKIKFSPAYFSYNFLW
jgi:hypothetical protein